MKRFLLMRILVLLAVVALARVVARPDRPGPFYAQVAAEGSPCMLIRAEPFADVPEGAVGWRILHTAARPDGSTALSSAIVVAPQGPGPFPVIGWAHGTTGVVSGRAPLVIDAPFANIPGFIPGFPDLLSRGWAMVAPDYPRLGAAGPHLYLVGAETGRAVLDALVAARAIPDLMLAPETVL